jgi:hypothetical protein
VISSDSDDIDESDDDDDKGNWVNFLSINNNSQICLSISLTYYIYRSIIINIAKHIITNRPFFLLLLFLIWLYIYIIYIYLCFVFCSNINKRKLL